MTGSMYTEQMRLTLQAAPFEAGELGHAYIGTEHIFLALLKRHRSLAITALGALGIKPLSLRDDVQQSVLTTDGSPLRGNGALLTRVVEVFQLDADLKGHLSYSSRATRVLELSKAAAADLGHSYVGTEHLLLGLASEGEGLAAVVLSAYGATPDRIRAAVVDLIAAGWRDDEGAS